MLFSATLAAAAAATTSAATTKAAAHVQSTEFLYLIFFIIFVALIFDFLNGFHDAANSIATIVSTRVLSPTAAVGWAAFFNFVAAFVFGTAVSETISKGLVEPKIVDIYVVFGGLLGAIFWNITTWLLALPTSSSHALVSGLAGAAVAKAGMGVLIWPGKWKLLLIFIVAGPLIGFVVGTLFMTATAWIFRRSTPNKVDGWFRRLQMLSAAVFSLSHGGNDAQKTMGIIVLLLAAAGHKEWTQPSPDGSWFDYLNIFGHSHTVAPWVILTCHVAIGLGTFFGGWRIVKTMGSGITRLQPVGGFCAETSAASVIIAATHLGIPISTTHAITGSILGVGTTKGVRSVRWPQIQRIVTAWILTIPCSAFVGALTYFIIRYTIQPLFGAA
jgi:inorganic phosphate transporter, PiT family